MKAERRKKHDKNLIKSRTSNKLHKFGDPIFLNHFVFYSSIYIEIMNSPKHKKANKIKSITKAKSMNSSSPCTVGFTKIGAFGGKLEKICKNLPTS